MPKADSREGNKQLVKTLYEECLNTGNFSLLPRLISKSYVGPRGEKGPSGFESTVLALRRGFPDIKFTLEDLVAEGDRITVRWKWQGSHRGTYRGFPASQNQVTNEAIAIYQVENGK
ncbi:MAG TPA: ester cyclase, partial [Myxococcaceae bacterium]|nr:ester cyclase [Myxococcaceae bacterium]